MLDLEKLTQVLNMSSQEMKSLSQQTEVTPQKAMASLQKFVPKIVESYQQLQSTSFDEIRASVEDSNQMTRIQSAIQTFLTSSKEVQEKAGAVQAALFSNPAFTKLTDKLQDLSEFLKRGVKVEKSEFDAL